MRMAEISTPLEGELEAHSFSSLEGLYNRDAALCDQAEYDPED